MLTLLVYGYVDADVYVCDLVSPSLFDEAPCICTHVLDVQFRKCLLTDEDSHMDIHWHVSQEKKDVVSSGFKVYISVDVNYLP